MFTVTYLIFGIFLLLALGAVIAFALFVVKPLQTQWAIVKARQIVKMGGTAKNAWQFRNVYRILATAHNDLEAARLWQQLDDMKREVDNPRPSNRICVGILAPPNGKKYQVSSNK